MITFGGIDDVLAEDKEVAHGQKPNIHGLWCMVRWECNQCGKHSRAYRLLDAIADGKRHSEETGHKDIDLRHGFFLKEDYGTMNPREGIEK